MGKFGNEYLVKPGTRIKLDRIDADDYKGLKKKKAQIRFELAEEVERLCMLQEALYAEHKHRLLLILQAMDTGGKDGTVRQVFGGVNPAGVRVTSFKAPNSTELDHDYLWRVHRRMPGRGEIGVFNRSHYEDVLVVRVEGFINTACVRRRFAHINDFERMLVEEGTTVLKCFLHIDRDEQKRRLIARRDDPNKQWKICQSDLDDRKRWDDFQKAYDDMLSNTSTEHAPWYIVPANSKPHRSLIVARLLVRTLERLDIKRPQPQMKDLERLEIV